MIEIKYAITGRSFLTLKTTKGLFICARSTVLARFLRSRLTTLSFVKISRCSYEKAGPVTEISVFATEISEPGLEIFPYEDVVESNTLSFESEKPSGTAEPGSLGALDPQFLKTY